MATKPKAKPAAKKKAPTTYTAGDQNRASTQWLNAMVTGSKDGVRRSSVDAVARATPKPKKKAK